MGTGEETRSARKHRAILEAADAVFLDKGYDGASMDEVAARAAVSKQTVYKHFADKEQLFAEIVLATTDRVDDLIELIASRLAGTSDLPSDLGALARQFLATMMQPELLRLRRLVIANADRFPDVARTWYERGFERVLTTLATSFSHLTTHGHLRIHDPDTAAHHFAGLLLWIPINKAMFCGNYQPYTQTELDHQAHTTTHAFLTTYSPPHSASPNGYCPCDGM